jgi:hypothetical protein
LKKGKRKKKTLFTGSSLKTAPQSRSGKEVVQLDHLNTLNSSLFFLLLLFGLKENILGGTREKIPRDSMEKKLRAKGKRRRKTLRWAIAYSVGVSPETL